jgi:hypothetical protein
MMFLALLRSPTVQTGGSGRPDYPPGQSFTQLRSAWEEKMDTVNQRRDPLFNEQVPSAEDWQARVDRLQEVVSLLLMKNQTMRMALSTEEQSEQIGGSF